MLRGSILSLNSSINSGDAGSYLRNCIAACKNRPSMDDEDPHKDVVFERLNALRLAKEEEEDDTRRLSESSGDCDDDDIDDNDGDSSRGTICEPMTTTERKEHREREAERLAMAEKGVAATSAATPAATATPDDPHRVENMRKTAKAAKEMNDLIDQILNNNIQCEPPPRDLHYHAASQQKLSRKLSRISTLSNGNDDDDNDDDDDDEKSTSSSISTAHNLVDDIIRLKLLVANQQATIDSFELTNRRLKYFEARNKELEMELMEARGAGREGHNHQATEWNGGVNQEEGRLRRMPSMRRQASVRRSMPPNPTPLHSDPSSNPMRRSMPPLRNMHSDRSLPSSSSRVTAPATAAILPPQSTVVVDAADRQRKELEWTVDALERSECRRRRVEADSSRIHMQLNDSLERERTLRRETRELEERNGELMRESSELRAQLGNFNSGRVSGSSKGSSSLAAPLKVGEVSFNQSARNSTGRTSEDTMTTWSSTEESTNNVDVSDVWKSMPNMDSSGGWT